MKKLLFAALALFIVNGAVAQIKVGVKVGENLSTITDAEYATGKFGIHVGGFAEFVLNDRLSIQPELLFSMQGTCFEDIWMYGSEEILISDYSLSYNYINVPILLKINIVRGLSAEVGTQVGFLLSAKSKYSQTYTSINTTINTTSKNKKGCNTFDVAAVAGLSYTFAEKFVVSTRYGLGLTNLHKLGGDKSKNSVMSLGVGFKFN